MHRVMKPAMLSLRFVVDVSHRGRKGDGRMTSGADFSKELVVDTHLSRAGLSSLAALEPTVRRVGE